MANQKITNEKKNTVKKSGTKTGTSKTAKAAGGTGRTVKKTSAAGPAGTKKQSRTSKAEPENLKAKGNPADELPTTLKDEILLAVALLLSILFFLSCINLCGTAGTWLNYIVFGLFGLFGYLFPFIFFILSAFAISNRHNRVAKRKIFSILGFFVCIAALIELAQGFDSETKWYQYFTLSAELKSGGGLMGGIPVRLLCPLFDVVATAVIMVILMLICLMLLTGREIFAYIKKLTDEKMEERKLTWEEREERYLIRELEAEDDGEYLGHRSARVITFKKSGKSSVPQEQEAEEPAGVPEEPVSFVDALKAKGRKTPVTEDSIEAEPIPVLKGTPVEMQEITPQEAIENGEMSLALDKISISGQYQKEAGTTHYEEELKRKFGSRRESAENPAAEEAVFSKSSINMETGEITGWEKELKIPANPADIILSDTMPDFTDRAGTEPISVPASKLTGEGIHVPVEQGFPDAIAGEPDDFSRLSSNAPAPMASTRTGREQRQQTADAGEWKPQQAAGSGANRADASKELTIQIDQTPAVEKKYEFPPLDLLAKPKPGKGANERELKETAIKLQKTLESFGVRVTITNISCGPSVTQYELQPEQGVKVAQITKLSDDIKLNLAASDIRIEAPIPGKAAVGIEIPNKENTAVVLREVLESREFKEHKSKLAFAVGKNISGQNVVSDIAKMPHMLIAGATGSGKSVCINTIIMSILYKADPKDVRLIMVDPKVVELSIYNGIPHLLIPVVTDPKKASAALNWAVAEMTDRYKKFAELGVRDLTGYNERVRSEAEQDEKYPYLPQIVIIVDELADLMMVASGEVEEAICRLAQMARAAGLHLIIATQRPSVNVITGLIKANVPSRVAFAVTSAIDSRTILDGVGAEKLLGKGDMLFFPSSYPKPVRIQGAFVSDSEVNAVVDFLKEQTIGAMYNEEVTKHILTASVPGESGSTGSDQDDYFVEAGKFIIEKEKASIGMLQRVYKIGFNRAARIMDQLTAAGVVGPEEGTKPRKILMTMEEFNQYVDSM